MAMNVAEAAEMTAKAKEKGVLALIDHELRFQDGRQKAFQMLRDGAIGKIRHAKYNFRNASRGDARFAVDLVVERNTRRRRIGRNRFAHY